VGNIFTPMEGGTFRDSEEKTDQKIRRPAKKTAKKGHVFSRA